MANELLFHFSDRSGAELAFDTLQELGYKPKLSADRKYVQIHLESDDLTSALEISQASGGTLVEEPAGQQHAVFQQAYPIQEGYEEGLAAREDTAETLRLPAHLVTEDFPEFYMQPESET
ncbi:hypothetical protein XYCOK13_01870 [Xylanibacillus composti]|uniref:Uncharacterized protein n=2 Tax=Xylanibacillus composti TaxID=1572762 RepID=A0A8J4GY71_9BACL|nr:hypothetical protein XYCOK13_01870 [Xylanibacillus composti]